MRSIENKRDQLIISNTGPTGLITKDGQISELLNYNVEEFTILNPKFFNGDSIYNRFGETPIIIIFSLLVSINFFLGKILRNYSST